jgi:hypothetical protein
MIDTRRLLWPIGTAVICYVTIGFVVYMLFYANHPYDSHTGEDVEAFKTWFWITFSVHIAASILLPVAVAWRFRWSTIAAVTATAVMIALTIWWLLSFLSFANTCETGLEFPFKGHYC